MVRKPQDLADTIPQYREMTEALGKPPGSITAMTGLPAQNPVEASDLCDQYQELGVDRLVCGIRYDDLSGYRAQLEALARLNN